MPSETAVAPANYTATSGTEATVTIVEIAFTHSSCASISRDGTNVVILGAGGPLGKTYRLLASTNPTLQLTQWTTLATNLFDGNGNFRHTNAINPALPSRFFRTALLP